MLFKGSLVNPDSFRGQVSSWCVKKFKKRKTVKSEMGVTLLLQRCKMRINCWKDPHEQLVSDPLVHSLRTEWEGRGGEGKAYRSSLSMTETEMKVWRLGVPSTTVLPHISMAPFSEKTKHSMNLTIDFPFTAPQDTKQGHHYGLYSLQEELKTV